MTTNTRNSGTDSGNGGRTVLVTSGTGKTGRRVVERLRESGLDVRSGSRGAGDVRFDWDDPSTWEPALTGADAAYVAYYPDLAAPTAPDALRELGRIAARCAVREVVLLSGRGEPEAVVAERALREAADGVVVTVVRAAFFAQNFSEGPLAEGLATGELVFPAGRTAEPFVDADDLADVVVAVLAGDGQRGGVHEVTGPRPLTFDEVAAELSRATGRAVRYVPVTPEQYAAALEGFGMPRGEAVWLAELFGTLLDGHNSSTTEGVKQVLGRDPKDFAEFADGAAAAGVWGA
ncbi:NmrA family NAD(P)-binding protein [Streptomyces sp. NPDC050504]|uniref:NmrA family NAD(P)-binding protein n=1 Tax=Streptomyces sp. NPDC050504 TaxID=3365618 RepID=UPI00378D5565